MHTLRYYKVEPHVSAATGSHHQAIPRHYNIFIYIKYIYIATMVLADPSGRAV